MSENYLDHRIQNGKIKDAILESIAENFPIEHQGRKLLVDNIYVEDKLRDDNFPEQKKFKISRKTWQTPIKADLKLVDGVTGKVISKKSNVKIGSIPKLTNRFTTIIDGNEYQTTNQLRRRSGVYATVQQNGILKSEFNLSKGKNFSLFLDPTSQVFSLVYREKNRKYRLWTILNALGVADSEITKAWGDELLAVNKKGALNTEASELTSIYKILYGKEPANFDEVISGINYYFDSNTEVDNQVTLTTLGKSFSKIDGETLLLASTKLLNILKEKDVPDERDSLVFKELLGVDDLLSQHFKKQQPLLKSKITRTMGLQDDVRNIISASTFTKPIKNFFTTGDLTSTPEQTNPVKIVADWRSTTPMGTGGITSGHQITLETRDVQPTHLGFLDPLATPESGKVGVTVGLASETTKTDKGLSTPVLTKDGKKLYLNPVEFYESIVGMPDQYTLKNSKPTARQRVVKAYHKGQPIITTPAKIQFYMRAPQSMFSFKANLIPFLPTVQSNRASMGAKMITQAVPLDQREEPLVQVIRSGNETYEDLLGGFLSPVLGKDPATGKTRTGVVTSVDKNYITIKTTDGKSIKRGLYHNFPLNQDGYLDSEPLVQVGDKVNSSTPLADNNYSTGETLAIGKNLNVAYMSYKGYNFEDAAVLTESAAEKLAHTMIHKLNVFFTPKMSTFDLTKFRAHFPLELEADNAKKLDERGIIKKGQKVLPGEAVIAFLSEKELDVQDKALRRLDKVVFSPYKHNITTWDEEDEGIVTDVSVTGRNIDVYIKSSHKLKEGDKISGRYGNKSIITKIIPDDQAPHTANGEVIDLMLNPHTVPGRMNTGQLLETAAGKLAAKKGKVYKVKNFEDPKKNYTKDLLKELKDNKIEPNEILLDGKNGKPFKNKIFTGKQYVMKLRHHVKKKIAHHGIGQYDINEQPIGKGAQKIGPDMTYALIAHGAKATLRDMSEIKGRKNDEYWRNIQLGLPPIKPTRNFVFDKMTAYLKAGGVNVDKKGNLLQIMPLTDKKVRALSNGEITEPAAILMGKNLAARKGGLFDPIITGGVVGDKWSHIKLARRIPNPMYEAAIIKALDLTQPAYDAIIAGQEELDGATGTEAIIKALSGISIKKKLTALKKELKGAPETNVNVLNAKIRNLQALVDLDMTIKDAYTTQYIPILPPKFRPIYPLPSGDLVPSDINKHYRDIGAINQTFKEGLKQDILDSKTITESDLALYNSVKAMQGFIDPKTYGAQKYKGIIKELRGKDQAKSGFIQGAAWARRQDLSARSTITVEPTLGINEVGIPKDMAYTVYKPFVIRSMKQMGIPTSDAVKYVKEDNPFAQKALLSVMEKRPLLLNRAPSLHKHSIQAFYPQVTEGKSIRLNPLIVKGFNADFDGDTMGVHVPVSKEAVEEATNMVPSKILFKHGDNALVPGLGQDYQLGLYYLSQFDKSSTKKYTNISEAKKDLAEGKITMQTKVTIGGVKCSIGQYMINKPLPGPLQNYKRELNGKQVKDLLTAIGKNYPSYFVNVINTWKNLGAMYAHSRGTTLSLTDFDVDRSYRDTILMKELPKLKGKSKAKRVEGLNKITQLVQKAQDAALKAQNNAYDMINSGSLSEAGNVRQMISMPGVLTDVKGQPLDLPVLRSYAEGLDTGDYFNTHYAARKGTVDRAVNTQESGALNKAVLTVTRRLLIIETDCGTRKSIEVELDDNNVLDRYVAETIPGVVRRNQLIDSEILLKLKGANTKTIHVRSPLTCEAPQGLCQHCYGLLPNGSPPALGTNVGALDAHAVTERATQLTMQTFHTGGAATTGGVVESFPRLQQLLKVPQTLKGQAILSPVKGKVKGIDKNLTGGYDVRIEGYGTINDKTITIPAGRLPVIQKGDKVTKGDRLSEGSVKPQELGELKDHLTAQQYIVDQLDGIYDKKFYRKTFETVVRSMSDNAVVTEAPDNSGYIRGDKASTSYLKNLNKDRKRQNLAPVKYKEYFKSVDTLNVDYPDFLTQFTTNRLKSALTTGAAKGNYANIKGKDPIPAYLYGEGFGKGDAAKGEFY